MSFVRQFVIYGVGGAATRLAAVALVPLYTRTLSIPQYGALEILLAINALTLIMAGMQLESSVARDFYEERARGQLAQLGWSVVWLTAAGAAAISVLLGCVWSLGWLPAFFGPHTIALLLALTFPAQIFGVQLVMLRFAGRPMTFTLASFCDLAISAVFSIWFIVGLHAGIDGALAGMLAGKVVCVAVAWPATFGRWVPLAPRSGLVRRILSYGIPSIPAVLIGWVQNAGSRLLLAVALTLNDVAIGGIAIKVAVIYAFVVYSFRLAWEPFSIAKLEQMSADPGVFRRTLDWYMTAMFLIAGAASLVSPQVVRVLAPPGYARSGTIAVLFLMGQFWVGMTNVLVIGIHGARRTALLIPVYGYGAALNVVILFALAPFVGVAAAGLGFMAGTMLSAFMARHYSNKHFNTGFTMRAMVWTGLASMGFVGGWFAVCLHFAASGNAPVVQAKMALLGLLLLVAATALIATKAIDPGRGSVMWGEALGYMRRTGTAR